MSLPPLPEMPKGVDYLTRRRAVDSEEAVGGSESDLRDSDITLSSSPSPDVLSPSGGKAAPALKKRKISTGIVFREAPSRRQLLISESSDSEKDEAGVAESSLQPPITSSEQSPLAVMPLSAASPRDLPSPTRKGKRLRMRISTL